MSKMSKNSPFTQTQTTQLFRPFMTCKLPDQCWLSTWNTPLYRVCLTLCLPVCHSLPPAIFFCQCVLWSLCEMECSVYPSWHVCNPTIGYAAAWMIVIKAFVSRERTEHIPPLLYQPVRQTALTKVSKKSCGWVLSAGSDVPQSSHFYYSNHIFCLLSDPLLLEDQLPSRTRGRLLFLHQRKQLRDLPWWGSRSIRFFIVKQMRRKKKKMTCLIFLWTKNNATRIIWNKKYTYIQLH